MTLKWTVAHLISHVILQAVLSVDIFVTFCAPCGLLTCFHVLLFSVDPLFSSWWQHLQIFNNINLIYHLILQAVLSVEFFVRFCASCGLSTCFHVHLFSVEHLFSPWWQYSQLFNNINLISHVILQAVLSVKFFVAFCAPCSLPTCFQVFLFSVEHLFSSWWQYSQIFNNIKMHQSWVKHWLSPKNIPEYSSEIHSNNFQKIFPIISENISGNLQIKGLFVLNNSRTQLQEVL